MLSFGITVRKLSTSLRSTMSCDIVCCRTYIPPLGALPRTGKRSCGRFRLSFPSIRSAREVSDQFMFGAALLINPVTTEGATQRTLYLPAGSNWVDFWTGKSLNGGKSITADAPLDRIPIYAKSGSIVAFGPPAQSASAKSDPIDLRIYPGADGDFTLYEDEGDNYDYEHGAYSVIPIHWDDKAETLAIGDRRGSFPGMLEHRTFRILRVTDAHGVGISSPEKFDATVEFGGKVISIHVPLQSGHEGR